MLAVTPTTATATYESSRCRGPLLLPGENAFVMHEPHVLKEHRIKVGVNENRELVWLDGEEQIEPERLAGHIVMILMNLISRANQGKVEKPRR